MYINQEQPREITGSGGYENTLSFKFLDAIREVLCIHFIYCQASDNCQCLL